MPTMGAFEAVRQARAGGVQPEAGNGAVERRVAEAEDAPVGGDEPVPVPGGGRRDPDHRTLQMDAPRGAVERGRAEREDAAVRADQPVAVGGRLHREGLRVPRRAEVVRALRHAGRQRAGAEAHEGDRDPVRVDAADVASCWT